MIRKIVSRRPLTLLTRKVNYTFFEPPKFDASKDYYSILGVSKNTPDSDLKKAYYKLARQYHPDHVKGYQSKFKEINEAYETLSDEKLRKQYDSMRTFGSWKTNMGSKAQQGQTNYNSYQQQFYTMSPEEQAQVKEHFHAVMRRVALFLGGLMLFWMVFSRKPHMAYNEFHGVLSPIENPMEIVQPQQYAQTPSYPPNQPPPYNQYQQPLYQSPLPPPQYQQKPQNPYNYSPQPRQQQQNSYQNYPQATYAQNQNQGHPNN